MIVIFLLLLAAATKPSEGFYGHPPPEDPPPPVVKRDPAQVRAFRKVNACPSTQKFTGACAGWVVDHIIPLCWGGEDKPLNMQWQEVKASYIKDVFERQACALKKKVADGKLNE